MAGPTVVDDVIPDLSDPRTFVEAVPHDGFRLLRERDGLYWQPTEISPSRGGYWAVTRFEDIVAIERDTSTFTSTHGVSYPLIFPFPAPAPLSDNLMFTDPPRHAGLRRSAAAGFAPRVVANFDPWVREIVREAIADVESVTEFDYVQKFARTIPAYVIGRVLGCPREDRQRILDWTDRLFAVGQQTEDGQAAQIAAVLRVQEEIEAYCAVMQERKRKEPADDMFTALGKIADAGDITQSEFLQWTLLIMTAGFETTHTAIGQSMRLILENEDIRSAADRAIDEGLSGKLADEFIRFITPAMQMARLATRDVEVAGTNVLKGDAVVLYFVAANRDASVFAEPDTFNPWRTETATLAFGSGVHRCIGSYLAKLEVQILFEELRAAGVRLRLNGAPKRGWSNFINQIAELPVARA
ncbi:cytochrome P450 [Nocardia sp. NPDC052278]|uniref:cytochrome P450 n=1 Tax=unclassified Nocardia TaxID=2637762 RepID=UPI0036A88EA4